MNTLVESKIRNIWFTGGVGGRRDGEGGVGRKDGRGREKVR